MEIWKQVEDYENYEISNYGRIKNIKTGNMLKQTIGSDGYKKITIRINKKLKTLRIHRLVAFAFCNNKDNKNVIDHIDRDKTNNHFSNLRYCNKSENAMNCLAPANNTSGVRGVCFDKRCSKWLARITIKGKSKHIGHFDTIEEAKEARLEKEKEIYGEFSPN